MTNTGSFQCSTCTLFGPRPIPGLIYHPDFINETEEFRLLAHIDAQPWNTDIRRRTQYYGSRYREDGSPGTPGVLPEWLLFLAERLKARGIFAEMPDRAGINDYAPGAGIGAHRDQGADVIEVVAILSLLSPIAFEMTRLGHETQAHWLQPRSLFVMQGEARHKWFHGIPARMSDRVGGLVVPRRRRVSVTFRCMGGAMPAAGLG